MKLVIPCLAHLDPTDARLMQLAEFMGGQCELLPLPEVAALSEAFFESQVPSGESCLVINPAVLRHCFSQESFPVELASYLLARFSFVIVHNLRSDPFSNSTLRVLSEGRLQAVCPVERRGLSYEIADESRDICGHFAGLTFGPVDPAHDTVFLRDAGTRGARALMAIGKQPFFADMRVQRAQVFFLAGGVIDLATTWDGEPLTEYFSRLLPAAMMFRHVFGNASWRPMRHHSTLIIDDPLLQESYGFLNYDRLCKLMDEYRFHTSIAFIPYNFRRSAPAIAQLFRERPDRFSICFHGNDHTAAEFAATEAGLLNSMLRAAEARMEISRRKTGIICDKVMVFPQGNFSTSAMQVLQARNFYAAVNTIPHPRGELSKLNIADTMRPGTLSYGFPLFLRKYVGQIELHDVAYNLFFGRPILITEHHTIFKDPDLLTALVSRINSLEPKIRWSNLRAAIENSCLWRRTEGADIQLRSYSNIARVENESDAPQQYSIEWPDCGECSLKELSATGRCCLTSVTADKQGSLTFSLSPGASRNLFVFHTNGFARFDANRHFSWTAKAFLRRRLSEFRDNYLSKNPHLLSTAQAVQKRFLHYPAVRAAGRPSKSVSVGK